MQSWKANIDQLDSDSKNAVRHMVMSVLGQTTLVLRNFAKFLEYSYSIFEKVHGSMALDLIKNDPLGGTHFACVLLHQALVRAASRAFGFPFVAGSPLALRDCMPWLRKKMELEGWCPYTIWRLNVVSDVEEMVYGYYLGSKRTGQDHSRCTQTECAANTISEDAEPKHIREDCNCQTVRAPLHEIVEIIRGGNVPILEIKTDSSKLKLEAHELSRNRKYAAVSHVWADGLGCPKSNSITNCQLDRISKHLAKLATEGERGELFVWIDTLCIPVDPDFQDLRESQITKMYDIYKNSHCVLVFDPDFLTMSDDAGVIEIGMRLYLSAWCFAFVDLSRGITCAESSSPEQRRDRRPR